MSSPMKSCTLDPVYQRLATFLLKEFVDVLLPYVTNMLKASQPGSTAGLTETRSCYAVAEAADMANYRPVSNVTFMSKIVERAVAEQLHQYLEVNRLLPRHQSAYRRHHSTETAMLRVVSDVLTAADAQQVTLLGLLDLSAAFDYVDHQLLLYTATLD